MKEILYSVAVTNLYAATGGCIPHPSSLVAILCTFLFWFGQVYKKVPKLHIPNSYLAICVAIKVRSIIINLRRYVTINWYGGKGFPNKSSHADGLTDSNWCLVSSIKHLPCKQRLQELGLPTLRYRDLCGNMISVYIAMWLI